MAGFVLTLKFVKVIEVDTLSTSCVALSFRG
jgi:hypothetical protein